MERCESANLDSGQRRTRCAVEVRNSRVLRSRRHRVQMIGLRPSTSPAKLQLGRLQAQRQREALEQAHAARAAKLDKHIGYAEWSRRRGLAASSKAAWLQPIFSPETSLAAQSLRPSWLAGVHQAAMPETQLCPSLVNPLSHQLSSSALILQRRSSALGRELG